MSFPIRSAPVVRAVLTAVVLGSAGGCTGFASAPAKADELPADRPETAQAPAAGTRASSQTDTQAQTDGRLTQLRPGKAAPPLARLRGLDLDRVRRGAQLVPQTWIGDLPDRLEKLARPGARKQLFIKTTLPAVLRANASIKAERDFLRAVIALDIPRQALPSAMRDKLQALAEKYRTEPGELGKLKRRVDVVPPALVLAQAAIETGWGTSRFAQQGNALFGQHTRDPNDAGMTPQGLEDPSFRVRTFETVTAAVEAYLRNLNTHPAYAKLRRIRADARARGDRPDATKLAAGLVDYSARGQEYVADIRLTIRANDLQAFAEARLHPRVNQLVDASSFAGK